MATRRRTLTAVIGFVAALAVTAAVVVTLALTRHPAPAAPTAVSTVAENRRACLLSDPGQAASATVFSGMQQAAQSRGGVNVQQATLPAQATDAAPELAGLIQQQCTVIFAVGPLSITAAQAAAGNAQPRTVTFVLVGDTAVSGSHISTLPITGLSGDRVAACLAAALG